MYFVFVFVFVFFLVITVWQKTSSFLRQYFIWQVWVGPWMVYKALEVIQIFLAGGRTDGRTNEGVPRGPRGPKNGIYNQDFCRVWDVDDQECFATRMRPVLTGSGLCLALLSSWSIMLSIIITNIMIGTWLCTLRHVIIAVFVFVNISFYPGNSIFVLWCLSRW